MNALGEAIGDEQRRASAAHEQLNSCHALGLADRVQAAGPGSRSARVHVCSPVRQSRQVVRQGLSGQILQQGMLTRPTDTLMRQAPKILFDKPAHVIAIRQLDRRNHILSKRSHQDMGAPAGVDLVNQTDTNAGGPAARRWAIVSPSALYRAQRKPCAAPSPRVANSMPRWSSPCANQVAAPPPVQDQHVSQEQLIGLLKEPMALSHDIGAFGHLRKTHIRTRMARSVVSQARNRLQSTDCDVNGACTWPAARSRSRSDKSSSHTFNRG